MAVFNKRNLLTELLDRTELVKANTQPFTRLDNGQLNEKPAPGKWSIAEIFEHLYITHGIYIRSILPRITSAPDKPGTIYKSNWFGDWVYERIMPRPDGTIRKMKAPKFLHATGNVLDGKAVLDHFLQQLDAIEDILQHSATKDLQKIKIPLSINRLLKLQLGDCLRFLSAHNERHVLQAQRVLGSISR
jgi:hypothetical protein